MFLILKDRKGIIITNSFQKNFDESNRKPNKIWVDKGSELCNRSMKSWLQGNNTEMHLTHNEGKSVVVERFIRTLKNKIYKYMTSVSKNVYIDKLDDMVNKCNNKYHSTSKMKPVDVKSSPYIDSIKEFNKKDHKFKIGDIARISKYKNILAKGYTPNWSEEVFVIKILCHGHMLVVILKVKKFLEGFMKKNCKKTIKKGDKLYV